MTNLFGVFAGGDIVRGAATAPSPAFGTLSSSEGETIVRVHKNRSG